MFTAKVLLFVCFVGSCYCREITHDVEIYDGHEINIEEAPYMASVQWQPRTHVSIHLCGGSIISNQFVLTAAHCCIEETPFNLKIRVGTNLRSGDGEFYEIEKIISHDNFSFSTANFDVCLIKLSTTLKFGTKVAPIQLDDGKVELPVNTNVNASGWGRTKDEHFVSNLMQVTIPIFDHLKCESMYDGDVNITNQMICAGREGAGVCHGDSGGPLTKKNVQVGIASFVKDGLCGGTYPNVFVNVSAVLPWIRENIAKNNLTNYEIL